MALINGIIPPQAFEIVHDRIGRILRIELENQFLISGNYNLEKITVWKERDIPWDKVELKHPQLNIMIERGDFQSQHLGQSEGWFRYIIEGATISKSTDDSDGDVVYGDTRAMNKLQNVLGKCRAILEDPKYNNLGFTGPFIMNRHIENVYFGKPIKQDTTHYVMGRLTFMVRFPEVSALIIPRLILGADTRVRLGLTNKGYEWTFDQPQEGETFDYSFDATFPGVNS